MLIKVKVSAKSARLPFHGCDPDYIRDRCHARCCEGSSGLMVTIHPTEQLDIEKLGGIVNNHLLQPSNTNKYGAAQRCPFKTSTNLCSLHNKGKPFGCISSPFTLNKNNTLIVRNRYKLLCCFNDGPRLPAYVAFRASFDLIFGIIEARRICDHLDLGGGDIEGNMSKQNWNILRDNDMAKQQNA
jgi:hypothetical protein